jgi:subtilisin-like proprotein convertase family protein
MDAMNEFRPGCGPKTAAGRWRVWVRTKTNTGISAVKSFQLKKKDGLAGF